MSIRLEAQELLHQVNSEFEGELNLLEEYKSNDSTVLLLTDGAQDLVLKAGPQLSQEYETLKMLEDAQFPAPQVLGFRRGVGPQENDILTLTKCVGVETRNLPIEDLGEVLQPLVLEMNKLREIKSDSMSVGDWKVFLVNTLDASINPLQNSINLI